jgi:hypothetical protein
MTRDVGWTNHPPDGRVIGKIHEIGGEMAIAGVMCPLQRGERQRKHAASAAQGLCATLRRTRGDPHSRRSDRDHCKQAHELASDAHKVSFRFSVVEFAFASARIQRFQSNFSLFHLMK